MNGDILIINDVKADTEVLAKILEETGYQVRKAFDSLTLFEMITAKVPDLIFLNRSVPNIDGFDVLRLLNNRANYQKTAVVFILPNDSAGEDLKIKDSLGTEYITKPFVPLRVISCVERNLSSIYDGKRTIGPITSSNRAISEPRGEQTNLGEQLHQLESESIKSVRFFQKVIDGIPEAVMVINLDYSLALVNQTVKEISGGQDPVKSGMKCFQIFHSEDKPCNGVQHPCPLVDVVKCRKPVTLEHIHPNSLGYPGIVELYAKPVFNENKEVVQIIESCRDISLHKHTLERLQESKVHFQEIVEGTDNLITRADSKGKITYVNHAAERVFGIPPVECIGQSVFSFVEPQDRERTIQWYDDCIQKKAKSGTFENRQVSKKGEQYDILWTVNFHFDDHGELEYSNSIAQDISEQKRQEQVLKARVRLSEFSFSHSVDELLQAFLDEAEVLTGSNIGFFHFVESDQKTLSLQMWSTNTLNHMCKAEGKGRHYSVDKAGVWGDALRERRPVIHNDYERLPNRKGFPQGHVSVFRELVVPVFRKDKIVAILGVGNKNSDYFNHDVKTVSELAEIAWEFVLRKRAEEDKATLENQLRQTQKLEAIGTLAGGIAHDFNNILHSMVGYTDLTKQNLPEGSSAMKYLDRVMLGASRATDLVQQILTFSRRGDVKNEPVEIASILKESIKFMRASLPATVSIVQKIGVQQGTVLSDPTQLHQVIVNLCTNAGHAMEKTGGVLEISLEEVSISKEYSYLHNLCEGDYLKLSIRDTGHGMPPEVKECIFEPFYTTKDPGEGTGLGLSVVHGIVKGCRGAITVTSEVGEGSLFEVYFPKVDKKSYSEIKEDFPTPTGEESILVVEDELMLLEMTVNMLEKLGYLVTAKQDATEALNLFRSRPDDFDLVISDQTMPFMTGMELSKIIKRVKPKIPIILTTGYSKLIPKEEAKEIRINRCLMKPFNIGDLGKTVREVLDE